MPNSQSPLSFPRRRLLAGAGALAGATAVAGFAPSAAAAPRLTLVAASGQRPRAQFVLPADAPQPVRDTVAEAISLIAEITGVTLTSSASEPDPSLVAIYVGGPGLRTPPSGNSTPTADGYALRIAPQSLTITGGGSWGVVNGIHQLLRMVGVEWLHPGPAGTVVPSLTSLSLPCGAVASDPVMAQRMLSPLLDEPGDGPYAVGNNWAAHNGLQGWHNVPVEFHHNLWSLFPVAEFGTSHPEYYANRKVPKAGSTVSWQPAFSNPATIDVAVAKIIEWFADNPDAPSFSLGVNDAGGYEVGVDPVDTYYQWVNAVATGVTASLPDKKFGLLAYHEVEPTPSFDLHPAVVPFFTEDRLSWVNDIQRQKSQDLLRAWHDRASALALYDYVYGWPYALPRMEQRLIKEALQFGASIGVTGFYAELYPNWGEGPKPWVLARLAWDPEADVDDLVARWCELAVGPAAAPDLIAYFAMWEDFWTNRITDSPWLRPGATYQDFASPRYLSEVTDSDISSSRTLMDRVVAKATSPAHITRAAMLATMWDYYEASAVSYPTEYQIPDDGGTALAILEDQVAQVDEQVAAAQRRLDLLTEFRADPLLKPSFDPNRFPTLTWSGWNASALWAVVVYVNRHESSGGPVTDRARALAASAPTESGREFAASVVQASETPQLLQNAGFETADAANPALPADWQVLPRHTGTRAISRDTSVKRTGVASCLSTGTGWGGPMQVAPAVPGLARFSLHYRAAPDSPAASVQISIDLCDANGVRIGSGTIRGPVTALTRDGQWHELVVTGEIPETVTGRPVETVSVSPLYESPGQMTVWTDDVELFVAPRAQS